MSDVAYVAVPTAVVRMLADGRIHHTAFALYSVMLSKVNRKRGDRVIWPSKETLAGELNMKKADNLDKYIAQLEAAGLVLKQRRRESRTKTTNRYVLASTGGHVSIPPGEGVSIPPDEGVSHDAIPPGQDEIPPVQGVEIPPGEGCEIPPVQGVEPTELEPTEVNQLKEPTASSSSSAPSAPKPRTAEEDEEARRSKIDTRKRRERAAAKRKILNRTDADDEQAEMLLDYLVENYNARNLDRYVDGVSDDELQERLDEITWSVAEERDERDVQARTVVALREQIAGLYPQATDQQLNEFDQAHLPALQAGFSNEDIVAALNASHTAPGNDRIRCYIDALYALTEQQAA
ncbi:MAG TPA: hypothetical protein VK453_25700 [Micromonosporaceae bacterium]|nr:hypothetical protein [Micromonosporaceae bacterium]